MTRWAALIRGIGPITHRKMSMAELRAAAEADGLREVTTRLATGNLLFSSPAGEAALTALLDKILQGFGLADNPVFLRQAAEISETLAANPFHEAAIDRPNHLLITYLAEDAPAGIHWDGPEQIATHGRVVFVDYVRGVGTSKLDPNRLARLTGQPGTARSWTTSHKLLAALT